jgi:HK97 gp10 family phage protein
MYAIADVLCARRTGFMASQLTVRLTEGGYGVAVGWYAEDFLSAGLSFYPPYVELGTSRMSAQPAIGPAFDVVAPQFELELAELVTAAIARQIARAAVV